MRFGLFGAAQAQRGGGPDVDSAAGFNEYIDYLIEAEALGYHSAFIVEHHFTGFGQVSATLNLLSWVGAKTSTLRLGAAVLVLPWHDPVLLAEQAATVDLLSGGRLDFGVGKGYRHNEFASFRIPMEESAPRFEESIDIITKSWISNERFSFHGKYWQYDDIIVELPTRQKPHPPFWQGAGHTESIHRVAARGHNLLLDQFASITDTISRFKTYKAAMLGNGSGFDPAQVGVARAFFVADTAEEKAAAVERRIAGQRRLHAISQLRTAENGEHHGVLGHAGGQRGKRVVRHARGDLPQDRDVAGGGDRVPAAEWRGYVTGEPAAIRDRGHAAFPDGGCHPVHGRRVVARPAGRSATGCLKSAHQAGAFWRKCVTS